MSDTPRVDSYVYKFPGCQREPRLIDFARQLEREIAEARAEINIIEHDANVLIGDIKAELERKDKLIEQMREALSWQCAGCPDTNDYGDKRHCDECSIKQLLSAAERMGK